MKQRTSVGGAYAARGHYFMRVTVAAGVRRAEALPWVTAEQWATHGSASPCPCVACERARHVQELVNRLREAKLELVETLIENLVELGAVADAVKMAEIARSIDAVVARRVPNPVRRAGGALTFRVFAERWTSGELHRQYPDHVRDKRTAQTDEDRLGKHIYPIIGDDALDSPNALDRALEVLRRLPTEDFSPASRRHVAQLMTRVYSLAVYPCRLLATSPLPKGFLPKLRKGKAKAVLYPDEDAKLLGTTDIPLASRMLYGYLAREGSRSSEALNLAWADLDLERSAVRLDKNKTDDPRAWALDPGTAEALRRFKKLVRAADDALVFEGIENRGRLAEVFRDQHLPKAKIDRPELFEDSGVRRPVRLHDLRATFVTVALANERSESWVTARTGHRSSMQIATYRRLASTFAEIQTGWFSPMHEIIPELRDTAAKAAAPGGERPRTSASRTKTPRRGPNVVENTALGSTVERRTSSSLVPCTTEGLPSILSPSTTTLAATSAAVNAAAIDPVEAALAAGIAAIAASMGRAPAEALAGLADRMGALVRELEARRALRPAIVIDLASRRR